MHPSLEELLALRDGDGAVETARHVERCRQCRAELEDLRAAAHALRALPSCPPPEHAWSMITSRLSAGRRAALARRVGLVAAIALSVSAALVVHRTRTVETDSTLAAAADAVAAVEELSNASRELEAVLRSHALQSRVLNPRQAAVIVELEDRIALVDMVLAENGSEIGRHTVALWSDRVELLDALVAARGGSAQPEIVHAVNRNSGRQR